jgi:glycosyltransferase involved in cell wall biosynthesis
LPRRATARRHNGEANAAHAAPAPVSRLRILMVTDFYHPFVGGVEVVVRNLARSLTGRGHHVAVATLADDGLPAYEEQGRVHVHRVRTTTGRLNLLFSQRRAWAPPTPDPEASVRLRRILDHERPDIIHGHDWLARSVLPVRGLRTPVVMSLHYYTVSCAKKSLMYAGVPCSGPALAKCMRCASAHYGAAKGALVASGNFVFAAAERRAVDLFLPVSHATAAGNGLMDGGPPYEVVPNFVGPAQALADPERELLTALPDRPFFLYVGDVRRDKGVHLLLEAHRRLGSGTPLVIVGKLSPAWSPELPSNVHLVTDWPNEAVREAQRRCLALVAPSVWPEPFGMVVIETYAAGRPVIASRIGGLGDLVEDGATGLVVTPGDVTELERAMAALAGDRELASRLAAGASRAASSFTADVIVPRFERAYSRVIEMSRRRVS